MTAILLTYLGTSYSVSGFLCSLAFLRHIDQSANAAKSKTKVSASLTCIAIALFWPLWMVKEVQTDEREQQQEMLIHYLDDVESHSFASSTKRFI